MKTYPRLIFSLIVLFVFYDLIVQIFPGVITHEVMEDLRISASGLGILSGIYFYPYLLMQIPAGLLFDRYSVRYVVLIPLFLTVIATALFSQMHSFTVGSLARFLMGVGTAFAFLSVAKVSADLFDAKRFPLLIGIAYVVAALGAIAAQLPLALLVQIFGWRNALLTVAGLGLILTIFIYVFVVYQRPEKLLPKFYSENIFLSLKFIFLQPQMWFIAIVSLCSWAPMVIFASLWGVPFLMKAYHFEKTTAASLVSAVWLGLAVASPLLGIISNVMRRRCLPIFLANILGVICFAFIISGKISSNYLLVSLLFLGGAACAAQPLTYSIVKEITIQHRTAAAMAFNNLAAIAAGAIFQPLTGYLINLNWQGFKVNNVPVYTIADYQHALILIPALLTISALISIFLIKETHCKNYLNPSQ